MSNLKNFNLENFVLHYDSILCFCNPQNIYHKNAESHESTKILTLKLFWLYITILSTSMSPIISARNNSWSMAISDQFQRLADQNPLWSAKFTVHLQWTTMNYKVSYFQK